MVIRRRASTPEVHDEERDKVFRAARLLVEGKPQQEIATIMGVSPSTISRLLNRAQADKIIQYRLVLPQLLSFQDGLETLLAPKGVRDVVVTAGGDGKNLANLGESGASQVLRAINAVAAIKPASEPIVITLSCGTTISTVIEELISLLKEKQQSQDPLVHPLEIYPSTLYGDSELDPVYPCTIVAYFAMMGRKEHLRIERRKYLISGHALQLPKTFYDQEPEVRRSFKFQWKIDEFETKIKSADIFLLGAGTIRSPSYDRIVENVGIRDDIRRITRKAKKLDGCDVDPDILQVLYTPIDREGRPDPVISGKLVGIKVDDIREVCRDPKRHVFLVAGGPEKLMPMQTVIEYPCYTNLITDSTVAREALIRHRARITGQPTRPPPSEHLDR